MDNPKPEQKPVQPSLESQKQQLEIDKLKQEILVIKKNNKDLHQPWYRKPQWIMAVSPIIIGLLTLVVAWASGFLQAQATWNKVQRDLFNKDMKSYDSLRESYQKIIVSLNDSMISLKVNTASLQDRERYLGASVDSLDKLLHVLQDTLTSTNIKNQSMKNMILQLQFQNYNLLKENHARLDKEVKENALKLQSLFERFGTDSISVSDQEVLDYIKKNKNNPKYKELDSIINGLRRMDRMAQDAHY